MDSGVGAEIQIGIEGLAMRERESMERVSILLLIALAIAVFFIVSCSTNVKELPESAPNPPHVIRGLSSTMNITIWEIDGCQYAAYGSCGLTHLQTCPNHGAVK